MEQGLCHAIGSACAVRKCVTQFESLALHALNDTCEAATACRRQAMTNPTASLRVSTHRYRRLLPELERHEIDATAGMQVAPY